ncbi:MAG: hypothetical protein JXP34_00970 [Planctomycetes bacterium]|nr:hypothetical protein [Planctomycetota bacterium]
MSDILSGSDPRRARLPFFSPRGLAARALLLAAAFAIAHVAGLRSHVTFLSGATAAGIHPALSAALGCVYLALYVGAVLIAPVLLTAAGILAVIFRVLARAPTRG